MIMDITHKKVIFDCNSYLHLHLGLTICSWQATDRLREMLEKEGKSPDVFMLVQIMRYVMINWLPIFFSFHFNSSF